MFQVKELLKFVSTFDMRDLGIVADKALGPSQGIEGFPPGVGLETRICLVVITTWRLDPTIAENLT